MIRYSRRRKLKCLAETLSYPERNARNIPTYIRSFTLERTSRPNIKYDSSGF